MTDDERIAEAIRARLKKETHPPHLRTQPLRLSLRKTLIATSVVLIVAASIYWILTAQKCAIKGNIGSNGHKLYYIPEHHRYGLVKIDRSAGEVWFCTDFEAIKAGWEIAPGS
jgi:hypothetical protein